MPTTQDTYDPESASRGRSTQEGVGARYTDQSEPCLGGFRSLTGLVRSPLGQITDHLEERLILELLGPVEGLLVLDVGCGDGALGSVLARRTARVTGLDADARMLAAARQRAQEDKIWLELVRGEAEALPFADGTFDRIVAVTVLCFVGDARRAIGEMARVLRPGGKVVIGELGR